MFGCYAKALDLFLRICAGAILGSFCVVSVLEWNLCLSQRNAGNVVFLALEQIRGLVSCLLIKSATYVNQH